MNKKETTDTIKNTLGASYSVYEVETMLARLLAESKAQAPYSDGRLIDRITRLQTALGEKP